MSKNVQGYMGPQIGKLGPAVGSRWKGLDVYRSYQRFVRNPKTPKQLKTRAHFSLAGKLAHVFGSAVSLGLTKAANAIPSTPHALFVKLNWDAINVLTPDSITVTFADLVCAKGVITPVLFGPGDFDTNPNTVVFTWSPNSVGCQTADDLVRVFLYCTDANAGIISAAVKRSVGTVTITTPAAWTGKKVHAYGFCTAGVEEPTYIEAAGCTMNPNDVSDSNYLGSGNLL